MARKNNPRSLRSSLWSNPMFCLYSANKETIGSWANTLQLSQNTFSFLNKIHLKNKKNKKKKYSSILKLTRSIVLSSSYSCTIMPLLSKAVTMPVQFQLNKLSRKNRKKVNLRFTRKTLKSLKEILTL